MTWNTASISWPSWWWMHINFLTRYFFKLLLLFYRRTWFLIVYSLATISWTLYVPLILSRSCWFLFQTFERAQLVKRRVLLILRLLVSAFTRILAALTFGCLLSTCQISIKRALFPLSIYSRPIVVWRSLSLRPLHHHVYFLAFIKFDLVGSSTDRACHIWISCLVWPSNR